MTMKEPLYPLTGWKHIQTVITAAPTTKWSQSQHELAISWKMWILQPWKGNINILQLPDLEKKRKRNSTTLLLVKQRLTSS